MTFSITTLKLDLSFLFLHRMFHIQCSIQKSLSTLFLNGLTMRKLVAKVNFTCFSILLIFWLWNIRLSWGQVWGCFSSENVEFCFCEYNIQCPFFPLPPLFPSDILVLLILGYYLDYTRGLAHLLIHGILPRFYGGWSPQLWLADARPVPHVAQCHELLLCEISGLYSTAERLVIGMETL